MNLSEKTYILYNGLFISGIIQLNKCTTEESPFLLIKNEDQNWFEIYLAINYNSSSLNHYSAKFYIFGFLEKKTIRPRDRKIKWNLICRFNYHNFKSLRKIKIEFFDFIYWFMKKLILKFWDRFYGCDFGKVERIRVRK